MGASVGVGANVGASVVASVGMGANVGEQNNTLVNTPPTLPTLYNTPTPRFYMAPRHPHVTFYYETTGCNLIIIENWQ